MRWLARIAVFGVAALAMWSQEAGAQAGPTITEMRDLFFGICDAVPGATYTVAAADNPGAGACVGATSGWFEVRGTPNARVRVTVSQNVTVSNGTDTYSVRLEAVPSKGNIQLDTQGELTIYVGGTVKLAGGTPPTGDFVGTDNLEVIYR